MYFSKTYQIGKIPVLEISSKDLSDKPAPLLIFYHGWTSCKEEMENFARILVKSGFRIIFPDVAFHGERYPIRLRMWDAHYIFLSVMSATDEFAELSRYFSEQNLIAKDFIAVAGVSMGGLITNAILRNYPSVKMAASMMGTAMLQDYADWVSLIGLDNLVEASSFFYPDRALPDERMLDGIIAKESNQIRELMPQLKFYDLSLEPEAIAYRPIYYWQAKPDPLIPCHLLEEFMKRMRDLEEAENIRAVIAEKGTHLLTLRELKFLTAFFSSGYQELADMTKEQLEQGIPEFWRQMIRE